MEFLWRTLSFEGSGNFADRCTQHQSGPLECVTVFSTSRFMQIERNLWRVRRQLPVRVRIEIESERNPMSHLERITARSRTRAHSKELSNVTCGLDCENE